MTIITITDNSLLRLLQLSSAALPVGGYSFSQGLEYAIEADWVTDAQTLKAWVHKQMHYSLARTDLPVLIRQQRHSENQDHESLHYWNAKILACRETAELLASDIAMGDALVRLLRQLDIDVVSCDKGFSFVTAFAIAASYWHIPERASCNGFMWAWIENQVAAACKLLPLGQTAAQQLLGELQQSIPDSLSVAESLSEHQVGASLPALSMASSFHETQYSRLFRS